MDTTKSIDLDGVEVGFHAQKSDRDGNGNLIHETYATTTNVQNLANEGKQTKSEVESIKENAVKQNEQLEQHTTEIEDAKRVSKMASKEVESIDEEVKGISQSNADFKAKVDEQITLVNEKIDEVISKDSKDKGAYVSLNLLVKSCENPSVGDSAWVQAPSYITGVTTFDAEKYWGDYYIGNKVEQEPSWHIRTDVASGKFFDMDGTYYEVLENVTYQLLADDTTAELLSHGHIRVVSIGAYNPTDAVPFTLFICQEEGVWVNTHATRSYSLATTINATDVFDGEYPQNKVNALNRLNTRTTNNNNYSLRDVLEAVIAKVEEISEKGVFRDKIESGKIPTLVLTDLSVSEIDDHTKFGMTFPLVFSGGTTSTSTN